MDADGAASPAKYETTHTSHVNHKTTFAVLTIGALGVVFGDIGTSPLYTLKECMNAAGGAKAGVEDLFGILSLMFWSLIMVVTVKYLTFVMRADNQGEGGIFALLAIVPERFRATAARTGAVTGMALLAVIGAALMALSHPRFQFSVRLKVSQSPALGFRRSSCP